MIVYLRGISNEGFLFNGSVNVTNVSLKFLIKVPTQKAKFSLYKNQIFIANPKGFSNYRSDFASKLSSSKSSLQFCLLSYMKHLLL